MLVTHPTDFGGTSLIALLCLIAFLALTPTVVFLVRWKRQIFLHLGVVLISWFLLSVGLSNDDSAARQAYLKCSNYYPSYPNNEICKKYGYDRDNILTLFTLLFGWIPPLLYLGFCLFVRMLINWRQIYSMNIKKTFVSFCLTILVWLAPLIITIVYLAINPLSVFQQ